MKLEEAKALAAKLTEAIAIAEAEHADEVDLVGVGLRRADAAIADLDQAIASAEAAKPE
jgi:hypothetical protein